MLPSLFFQRELTGWLWAKINDVLFRKQTTLCVGKGKVGVLQGFGLRGGEGCHGGWECVLGWHDGIYQGAGGYGEDKDGEGCKEAEHGALDDGLAVGFFKLFVGVEFFACFGEACGDVVLCDDEFAAIV